jgi:hypothetical protein
MNEGGGDGSAEQRFAVARALATGAWPEKRLRGAAQRRSGCRSPDKNPPND